MHKLLRYLLNYDIIQVKTYEWGDPLITFNMKLWEFFIND